MLKELNVDQARFVAILARAARLQRDERLGNVAEKDVGEKPLARGDHNPTAVLGFDPVTATDAQAAALREAVATLSPAARWELYTLMRLGQGHLAAMRWHRGLSEAEMLGEEAVMAAIVEDPDLHDHLTKGLYEAKLCQ
jgi:hypothetical protein